MIMFEVCNMKKDPALGNARPLAPLECPPHSDDSPPWIPCARNTIASAHTLGLGHHNIGIMTPASSDENRNDQINQLYIKEILKGSLPGESVPDAGKGHLIINGLGLDVNIFKNIQKTGL